MERVKGSEPSQPAWKSCSNSFSRIREVATSFPYLFDNEEDSKPVS